MTLRRLARILAPAAVAALTIGVLSACAPSAPWQLVQDDAGRVLLVASSNTGISLTAVVQGELVLVGGTCFGLEGEFGEGTVGFPYGTTITEEGLNIPGRGHVAMGDTIDWGGGTLSLDASGVADTIPTECIGLGLSQMNSFD